MKARITFSIILSILTSINLFGQQNVEKTLVKAFNLTGIHSVLIDVPTENQVVINEWNQEQMRVVMTVSLGNGSDQMLKSLVKVGRYNLDSADENSDLRVYLPGLEREVKLRSGDKLIENINFEIYVPANTHVKTMLNEDIAEKSESSF
ncbi:MAG: hypothetical protein R2825_07470 [Saprospiraceae bacterium]